ncbi:MAG: hypothetical protein K2X91_04845, partial [Thermoleophilia bacterium]|nr:hypothetical protein [Thermoleophilia bacterium]
MGWLDAAGRWLLDGAAGSFIVLTLGGLAVAACRQPVRRIRLILYTLAGALIVPALAALPVAPRWSIGLLPGATVEHTQAATTRPSPMRDLAASAPVEASAAAPSPVRTITVAEPPPTPAPAWRWP